MQTLSKIEFNRAIEENTVLVVQGPGPRSSQVLPTRGARFIITALVIAAGLGTGWLGGRILNDRTTNQASVAPLTDTPPGSASATSNETQRTSDRHAAESRLQPGSGIEQPPVATEPPSRDPESIVAPPRTPKVEKEDDPENDNTEDPAKEIGRQAFKKMLKDVKRMRRGTANKNGPEDPQ